MHAASVETIVPADLPGSFPIRLDQRSSRTACVLLLVLLIPTAALMLYPFALLAAHLTLHGTVRDTLLANPAAIVPLLIGLTFWAVLFAWPLKRIGGSVARRRTVDIDERGVTVVEHTLIGSRRWHEPLRSYRGVAHHVRTSLSGVRHELILAHPERDRTVLVAIAPRFTQPEIDQICSLFDHAEIPSRSLYKVSHVSGSGKLLRPYPRWGGARA